MGREEKEEQLPRQRETSLGMGKDREVGEVPL